MKSALCNPLCEGCVVDPSFNMEEDPERELQSHPKGWQKMVYKKGESIFREGSKPSGVFCLKRGKVKVHKTGSHKNEQILRFAREGQLLGTRALIRNEYFTSSATAIENSVLCFMRKQEFMSRLRKEQALKEHVLSNLANNLRVAEDKITQLSISAAKQRLAIIILRMIEVYGFEEDGKTVALELTREEMANLIGAVNETTIRLLSKFKKDKLIALEGRKLTVLKHEQIVDIALLSG